jgi:hypothetical protein
VLLTQDDGWHLLVVFWVSSIGNRTISYMKRRPANFTLYGIINCTESSNASLMVCSGAKSGNRPSSHFGEVAEWSHRSRRRRGPAVYNAMHRLRPMPLRRRPERPASVPHALQGQEGHRVRLGLPVRGTQPALVQFTVDSWYRPVEITMGIEGESASLSGFPECVDNLLQQQVAAKGHVGGEEGYLKPLPRKRRGTQHSLVAKRQRIA